MEIEPNPFWCMRGMDEISRRDIPGWRFHGGAFVVIFNNIGDAAVFKNAAAFTGNGNCKLLYITKRVELCLVWHADTFSHFKRKHSFSHFSNVGMGIASGLK